MPAAIHGSRTLLVTTSLLGLVSCTGFQAANPPQSNNQILFIVNGAVSSQSASKLQVTPLPIPHIPPGADQPQPFVPPAGQRQLRAIQPFSGLRQGSAALPDGQVALADVKSAPYQSGGRLTFRFPSDAPGYGHACTAQFIGSQGVLLTAAHCVWDQPTRAWGSNFLFDLQYNQGSYTQEFDWSCAAIVSGWTNGLYPYDYAFIKVRTAAPTGLGLEINTGFAHVDAIGYPVNYYSGLQMVHVTGNKDSNNPSAMPNLMSHGASGGAWILSDNSAASVNSFKYDGDDATMHGPVLTSTTKTLFDFVAGGCKPPVPTLGSSDVSRSLASARDDDLGLDVGGGDVSSSLGAGQKPADDKGLLWALTRNALLRPEDLQPRIIWDLESLYYPMARRLFPEVAPAEGGIIMAAAGQVPNATDLSSCESACSSGSPYCISGTLPRAVASPISTLVSMLEQGSMATLPKTQLQSMFQVQDDPCGRGDTAFLSDSFENSGGACKLRSYLNQIDLGVEVNVPERIQGRVARSPGSLAVSFPDMAAAPLVHFSDKNFDADWHGAIRTIGAHGGHLTFGVGDHSCIQARLQ